MIDLETARGLEKEADANNGKCTRCHQTLKIYTYAISKNMVLVLRRLAENTTKDTGRAVDANAIGLKYGERSQLTKLRLHGLIAKAISQPDGRQMPRHWLITRKGWQFMAGQSIPARVIVYNNQVLGHDDETTTIGRIDGEAGTYGEKAITEAESRTYADVRTPQRKITYNAVYIGPMRSNLGQTGMGLTIEVDRLQMGRPVQVHVVDTGDNLTYKDLAAFSRDWRVEREG